MRAFVTGGSGFIGSHLIDALLLQGWKVRALVHKNQPLQAPAIELVGGDICDVPVLSSALQDVDVVFHLASALGSAVIPKSEFRRINVEGTLAMLKAAQAKGVPRFIHVSSAGVLGSVRGVDAADEKFPPRPVSIYDQTKLAAERIVLEQATQQMDAVVVRPGWAYGPRDRRTFKLIKAICQGRLFVIPRGNARQTPVYIEDLVAGLLLASRLGQPGEVYHLAGNEILTARKIVSAIGRVCGRKRGPLPLPLFLARPASILLEVAFSPLQKEPPFNRAKLSFFVHSKPLSIEKAMAGLGFSPRISFERGLEKTLSWYKQAGWLENRKQSPS